MSAPIKFIDAGGVHRSVSPDHPLPVTGGGAGGGGGLTDQQLRATPVPMVPMLTGSGNIELVVTTPDAPMQLPSQACKQAVIANNSAKQGWVIQGGKKFPIFAQAYFTFFGITNTNQLSVQLPEAGDMYVHWES